jgi:hypothetical protein
VNQLPKSGCGKAARHVLWEPEAGDRLRRPGGRSAMGVPTGITTASKSLRSLTGAENGRHFNAGKKPHIPSFEIIVFFNGGAKRDRTADLLNAIQALSQLSYGPTLNSKT